MRERFKASEQELGHKIWTIVHLFYRSHGVFRDQFESYEKQVLELSRQTGIDREDLRLNSAELAGLLDLKKLERLRDGYIHELKDLCHLVFRGPDRTDLLDRYVSDIFHEISILKEEHYNVKTYAPLYEKDAAEVELRHILDEAHTLFPLKLKHIRYLFGRAQARLEEHLPSFAAIPLFIRSLYVHRSGFVAEAYPDGLDRFYRFMYPLGPLEGYYRAGLSFYHSGFFEEALAAFLDARNAHVREVAGAAPAASRTVDGRAARHAILWPLEAKIARLLGLVPAIRERSGRELEAVVAASRHEGAAAHGGLPHDPALVLGNHDGSPRNGGEAAYLPDEVVSRSSPAAPSSYPGAPHMAARPSGATP
jgi:hypothetical protein